MHFGTEMAYLLNYGYLATCALPSDVADDEWAFLTLHLALHEVSRDTVT